MQVTRFKFQEANCNLLKESRVFELETCNLQLETFWSSEFGEKEYKNSPACVLKKFP